MTNDEQRDWYSRGSGATGLAVEPLPFDRRAPLGALILRSQLTGAYTGRWKATDRGPTRIAAPRWRIVA